MEVKKWKKIESHFKYDQFLKDKGIKSYYDDLPKIMKDNRVYFGKFQRNTGEKIDADLIQEDEDMQTSLINVGGSLFLPNSMFWDDLYGVIFTSKSFRKDLPDEEILRESKLPPSIKIDTFYIFKYEEQGDTSGPIQEIPTR